MFRRFFCLFHKGKRNSKTLLTSRFRRCILTVLIQVIQSGGFPEDPSAISEVRDLISINYRDPRPIYEQIRDELQKLILTGVLPPGEKLPSVRELAQELAINPNTIQRAYRELEQGGYIDSVPGKGNFAALKQEAASQRKDELMTRLRETAAELRSLGTGEEELLACVREGGEKT